MEGRRLGPYRLAERLGAGGMGTVYRAVVEEATPELDAGTVVAVKVLHPHLAEGIAESELALAGSLAETGRHEEAESLAASAAQSGREMDAPAILVGGLVLLSRLRGPEFVPKAAPVLEEYSVRLPLYSRIAAFATLGRVSEERGHLERAREACATLIARSPEPARDRMVANLPLFRELRDDGGRALPT